MVAADSDREMISTAISGGFKYRHSVDIYVPPCFGPEETEIRPQTAFFPYRKVGIGQHDAQTAGFGV